MEPSYIYFILNKLNGKYYIGQTVFTPEKRWEKHKRDSRNRIFKNNYFSNAIRCYGPDNFEIRTLFVCCNQKDLDEAEIYFISLFDSTNSKFGYNATFGGKGGRKTEIAKKKMSEAQQGKKASSETKNKMSIAKKRKDSKS